jgi:hypothetical protein
MIKFFILFLFICFPFTCKFEDHGSGAGRARLADVLELSGFDSVTQVHSWMGKTYVHTNKFIIRRDRNLGNGMILFKVLKSSLVDGGDLNIKKTVYCSDTVEIWQTFRSFVNSDFLFRRLLALPLGFRAFRKKNIRLGLIQQNLIWSLS